jgi:hypothetical protein
VEAATTADRACVEEACPHCRHPLSSPGQAFCTRCGLALAQPCPNCSASLATPAGEFTECQGCKVSFWSCQQCGRLYHLDRTSCLNAYCPKKGEFWTAAFGRDTWDVQRGQAAVTFSRSDNSAPLPGWLGGGGKERRFASLHHSGLLISVKESGILEMWAERGAPFHSEGDEFREESVCLVRLDLGESATGPPIHHQGHLVILGTNSLCLLEMTSNPSLGRRLELPGTRGPLRAFSLKDCLLVAAPEGLWEVDVAVGSVKRQIAREIRSGAEPACDGESQVLFCGEDPAEPFFLYRQGQIQSVTAAGFAQVPEWTLFADRFLLLWRNQLAYLDGESLCTQELPAAVITRPVYCPDSERLIVLLSDGTIRSCSSTGERFSFVCDMPGVPTTPPLRVGEHVFYGSDGRYLCCDEEALLPRLNSAPWGELSFANGRLFGITKEGGLFAFCL